MAEETLTTTTVVKAGVKGLVVGTQAATEGEVRTGVDDIEEPDGELRTHDPVSIARLHSRA